MGKITFRLNKGKRIVDPNKPQVIYIRYIINQKLDFNASTGLCVLPKDWNEISMEVKNRGNIPNRFVINSVLLQLRQHFESLNVTTISSGQPLTYADAKKHFDLFANRNKPDITIQLFDFIKNYIEDATSKPNPNTNKLVAKSTWNVYKRTLEILTEFSNEMYKIDFKDIDLSFYSDFVEWCQAKDYSCNYIGKLIKTLKTFLNEATEIGVNTNVVFRSKRFSVMTEEVSKIYLDDKELNRIASLDLDSNDKMNIARNLFLIGSYTGLRVSDFSALTKDNFKLVNGKEQIHVKTKKTNTVVAIPLHPKVKEILHLYPETLTSNITEQELNRQLKEIGKLASIDSMEETSLTKGGKTSVQKVRKYELITTHTARRSFCTNAYLMGMDPMDIRSISGHKTEKAFLLYIKSTPQERALKIADHKFFN